MHIYIFNNLSQLFKRALFIAFLVYNVLYPHLPHSTKSHDKAHWWNNKLTRFLLSLKSNSWEASYERSTLFKHLQ